MSNLFLHRQKIPTTIRCESNGARSHRTANLNLYIHFENCVTTLRYPNGTGNVTDRYFPVYALVQKIFNKKESPNILSFCNYDKDCLRASIIRLNCLENISEFGSHF